MSAPEVRIYKVKGEWVDEPFITFGHAEMVLYSDYAALEAQVADSRSENAVQSGELFAALDQVQQLREALKDAKLECCDGQCGAPDVIRAALAATEKK